MWCDLTNDEGSQVRSPGPYLVFVFHVFFVCIYMNCIVVRFASFYLYSMYLSDLELVTKNKIPFIEGHAATSIFNNRYLGNFSNYVTTIYPTETAADNLICKFEFRSFKT